MQRFLRALFLALLVIAASGYAIGQTERGGISGQVTDNTGALLPGTVVMLKNEATGVVQSAKTNADGNYVFQDLKPGRYTITVNRDGFKKTDRIHTVVDVNQMNQQNISLSV